MLRIVTRRLTRMENSSFKVSRLHAIVLQLLHGKRVRRLFFRDVIRVNLRTGVIFRWLFRIIFACLPSINYRFIMRRFNKAIRSNTRRNKICLNTCFVKDFRTNCMSMMRFRTTIRVNVRNEKKRRHFKALISIMNIRRLLRRLQYLIGLGFPNLL